MQIASNVMDQHGSLRVEFVPVTVGEHCRLYETRMWANAQPDGRPAKHRWRPLFNAAKFGRRPLLDAVQ